MAAEAEKEAAEEAASGRAQSPRLRMFESRLRAAECLQHVDNNEGAIAEYESVLRDAQGSEIGQGFSRDSRRYIVCLAHACIADRLRVCNKYTEADSRLTAAASMAERITDGSFRTQARCFVTSFRGDLLREQGRFKEAARELERARVAAEQFCEIILVNELNQRLPPTRRDARDTEVPSDRLCAFVGAERSSADRSEIGLWLLKCCLIYRSLGDLLRAQRQFEAGERHLRRAERLMAQLPRENRLDRCIVFRVLGDLLRDAGRWDEADPWLERAVESAPPAPVVALCNALISLAELRRLQSRCSEATGLLRRARRASRRLPASNTLVEVRLGYEGALALLSPLGRAYPDEGGSAALPDSLRRLARVPFFGRLFVWYFWSELFSAKQRLERSKRAILPLLAQNRSPEGIEQMMRWAVTTFATGQAVCLTLWHLTGDDELLWSYLDFAEAAKCVTVREGLRRYRRTTTGDAEVPDWSPWPCALHELFPTGDPRSSRQRSYPSGFPAGPLEEVELPGEADAAKADLCQRISRSSLADLLPDAETVLIVFSFIGDDLVVLPICKGRDGRVVIRRVGNECFRLEGIRPRLVRTAEDAPDLAPPDECLVDRQADLDCAITQGELLGRTADDLKREADMTPVYQDLFTVLEVEKLMECISDDRDEWKSLHLVFVPDGPLYQFPLHAACCPKSGSRWYEIVASISYGLSLRTLELQKKVNDSRETAEADFQPLRGVVFGNRDLGGLVGPPLPGVTREVENLIDVTREVAQEGLVHWWVHGDSDNPARRATRVTFEQRYRAGNVLWCLGHGALLECVLTDPQDRSTVKVKVPSFALCDGPLTTNWLVANGCDFSPLRLVHFSACLLGRLSERAKTKEVEGFLAVLTMLRCRRVVCAMWHLSDSAAAAFAKCWATALLQHVFTETRQASPHAFAVAFKHALTAFRCSGYEHEFFWAPYMLYGLR